MSAEQTDSGRWAVLSDVARTQLWPVPAVAVVLATITGVMLPKVDEQVADELPNVLYDYLFSGGPDAARAVLSAVAGSMITVTSLTFSLTVVTLQLASSQFSPRLLRNFTRDRVVQGTLALFLATFAYSLTVLRTVRSRTEDQGGFVPQLSVTLAFLLAVASVLALVAFLSHLAREIRVETMLLGVHTEASRTARRVLGPSDDPATRVPVAARPTDARRLMAGGSGFLASVHSDALLGVATATDCVIRIDQRPGDSLVAGTPVGWVWSHDPDQPLTGERLEQVRATLADALRTSFERTSAQDLAFGLRQLTDVAVKALSPGINDPTTAAHALGHSSALLCEVADRDLGAMAYDDDQGVVRLVLARPDLADLLDLVVAQPLRYGAEDPAVLARIARLLEEVAWSTDRAPVFEAVAEQLARLRAKAAAADFDVAERTLLEGATAAVDDV
ncbi:MAG: DUF2254 domain-containing protein, partial [Candidatus Nanopelagicales bacterium]